MKFICRYESQRTGEQRDQICTFDPDEVAQVENARLADGDETAQLVAAAIVLRSGYSQLSALEWAHLGPPSRVH